MGQARSQTERRPSGDRRLGEAHDCGCGRKLTRLYRRRATRTSGAHLRADDDQRRFPGVSDAGRVRVHRLTPRPRRPRAGPGGPARTWRSAPQHIIAVNCTGVTPKKTRTAAAAAKSAPAPEIPPLNSPQLYINRELSLLAFQFRVLEEAQDERNPLLERVKILAALRIHQPAARRARHRRCGHHRHEHAIHCVLTASGCAIPWLAESEPTA